MQPLSIPFWMKTTDEQGWTAHEEVLKSAQRNIGLARTWASKYLKDSSRAPEIKDAAYQRPLSNLNEVLDHTLRCSPCFVESQRYVQEYRRKRLLFRTVLPIAASILIVAVTYFYWVGRGGTNAPRQPQEGPREIVSQPPTPSRSTVPPTPIVHAATIIIQSPIRGTASQASPKVYTLPREIVDLTLQMPIGYDEGTFEVQISGKERRTQYRVNAKLQGGLIRVVSRVDFSAFEPGSYQLTVTKIGESAKYAVPLNLE